MKVVVVGGVAGGATFASNLRRLDENVEIVMFEKDRDLSFGNCEIPYYLSGEIADSKELINRSVDDYVNKLNIKARNFHLVTSINREEKYVTVLDKINNKSFKESYDYLVLAPGTYENMPKSIEGFDHDHVFAVKNVVDVENIKAFIEKNDVKEVFIGGAGFVALEAAHALSELGGLNISMLIRKSTSLLGQIDLDLKGFIKEELINKNINIISGKSLSKIGEDEVFFDDGTKMRADLVISSLGVRPQSKLARDAGLNLLKDGSIDVDDNFRTSDPNIFAIGDVINPKNFITGEKSKLNLAWPAHRQAKFLASYLLGENLKPPSFIGTFAIKVFDLNVAAVGLNEKSLKDLAYDYDFALLTHTDAVSNMNNSKKIYLKILFNKTSGQIYGAQALGYGVVDKRIDVIASAIKLKASIYDLYDLELAYQPFYSTVEDATNLLAKAGINKIEGRVREISLDEFASNIGDFEVYDLRDEASYKKGHIRGAKSLHGFNPRKDYDKLPRDKKIVFYDENGKVSANSIKVLDNLGIKNVYALSGSLFFFKKYNDLMDLDMIEDR
ncbi:MAG: FAD-dependent oxidoreductase [Anaerococcus sp.]|nr:FAD-dependent oxidoreductase [Anaerococcus sp.]